MEKKLPLKTFTGSRHSKVVIWDNGDKGYAIQIQPPQFKDDKGVWQTGSIFENDLPSIIHCLDRALRFLEALG